MYEFKELVEADLSIIEKWLKKPHVKKFWDDGETWEESYEKLSGEGTWYIDSTGIYPNAL